MVSVSILTVGLAATTRTENVTVGGYYPGITVSTALLGVCWEGCGVLTHSAQLVGLEGRARELLWVAVLRLCPQGHPCLSWAPWLCWTLVGQPGAVPASCLVQLGRREPRALTSKDGRVGAGRAVMGEDVGGGGRPCQRVCQPWSRTDTSPDSAQGLRTQPAPREHADRTEPGGRDMRL